MASPPKKPTSNRDVDSCSFGKSLKDKCHQKTAAEMISFTNLSDDDQTVYRWRAGLEQSSDLVSICKYHERKFSELFKIDFDFA